MTMSGTAANARASGNVRDRPGSALVRRTANPSNPNATNVPTPVRTMNGVRTVTVSSRGCQSSGPSSVPRPTTTADTSAATASASPPNAALPAPRPRTAYKPTSATGKRTNAASNSTGGWSPVRRMPAALTSQKAPATTAATPPQRTTVRRVTRRTYSQRRMKFAAQASE